MTPATPSSLPSPATPCAERERLALALARQAGDLALGYFKQLAQTDIEVKLNGQDVVSVADRAVERFLREELARHFPADSLLGEEYGLEAGSSGYAWVIDPIDGTSCFVHGLDTWCVSIALEHQGQTVAGVVHAPCAGETFHASLGGGAFLDGSRIAVDGTQSLQQGLTGLGINLRVPPSVATQFLGRLLEAGGMPYRNGSGALMLAYVAAGRLIAYHLSLIHI